MDFCVARTSAIAADRICNSFEFQRSLSQHLHWYFPNPGRYTTDYSLKFFFTDPSISSPANNTQLAVHISVSSLALPIVTKKQPP